MLVIVFVFAKDEKEALNSAKFDPRRGPFGCKFLPLGGSWGLSGPKRALKRALEGPWVGPRGPPRGQQK